MQRSLNLPFRGIGSGTLRLFACALALMLAAAEARPQRRPRAQEGAEAASAKKKKTGEPPRFGDYPVKEIYRGRVAPVIPEGKRARMFRSKLREDARAGANFAGHYTVVFWGCGTGCAQLAVIDARTGRVYWPPLEYMDIPASAEDASVPHPNFRPDSKLLMLTRSHYDGRGGRTAYYYLFDNNRFRLLRRVEEREPDPATSPEQ
ncbi:MAG TPA: hypothetical protein VEY11_02505 [Pyrinomonadaceae bacterium]|nr:hypothetical protein [Pyrinomonadaceae bacterium]